ncbi:hypothetical protein Lser_V15G32109 [Lactuca serriola]
MLAAENAIVPNTNFSIWTENDIYVNMVQLSSISEQDYGNFYGKRMSHEIWDALHHAYEPTTLSCIFGSLRKRRCLLILAAIGHRLWLQPGYLIRANSHVSHDLSNLDFSKAYQGPNTLHVRNGKGLPILHDPFTQTTFIIGPSSNGLHTLNLPQPQSIKLITLFVEGASRAGPEDSNWTLNELNYIN